MKKFASVHGVHGRTCNDSLLANGKAGLKHTGAKVRNGLRLFSRGPEPKRKGNVTLAFPLKTRLLSLREVAEIMWRIRDGRQIQLPIKDSRDYR